MNNVPINKKVLQSRLAEIKFDLAKLNTFQNLSAEEFERGENFAIAEHYLRRALEAIFDIGNHILSRFPAPPGETPSSYKSIATALGKHKIIPKKFADGPLRKMAGYRHRLVHFYHEVTKAELHSLIENNLDDIEAFCSYMTKLIENPKKFNLSLR